MVGLFNMVKIAADMRSHLRERRTFLKKALSNEEDAERKEIPLDKLK